MTDSQRERIEERRQRYNEKKEWYEKEDEDTYDDEISEDEDLY